MLADLSLKPGDFFVQHLPLSPAAHQRLASRAVKFTGAIFDALDKMFAQLLDALRHKHAELTE